MPLLRYGIRNREPLDDRRFASSDSSWRNNQCTAKRSRGAVCVQPVRLLGTDRADCQHDRRSTATRAAWQKRALLPRIGIFRAWVVGDILDLDAGVWPVSSGELRI